ncbi:MAG: PilZ domain-containing protein [Plesiomonas sp.]
MEQAQFFSVHQHLSVNIIPLRADETLPDDARFDEEIPLPFRIAAETAHLDISSIRSLRNIGSTADDLMGFLRIQQQKIDLVVNYILAQEDQPQLRHLTHTFSAGGFSYFADTPPASGSIMRIKLFLSQPAAAVYAYGEVSEVSIEDGRPLVQIRFIRLRDKDQDLLIRAALHEQQQQLKQRAELRVKE